VFPHTFRGTTEERKDLAKVIAETELPGLVALALTGAGLLLNRGSYTIPESSVRALATWKRVSNSVASFIHECTSHIGEAGGASSWPRSSAIHVEYLDYCKRVGFSKPVALVNFSRRVRAVGIDVERSDGTRLRLRTRAGWKQAV
jgi:phage/plasmid-associated DNA primase